jgi:hypothetical protein
MTRDADAGAPSPLAGEGGLRVSEARMRVGVCFADGASVPRITGAHGGSCFTLIRRCCATTPSPGKGEGG